MTSTRNSASTLPKRQQLLNLLVWLEAAEDLAFLVESSLPTTAAHLETWFVRSRARFQLLLSLCAQLLKVQLTGSVLEAVCFEARVAYRILMADIEFLETKGHHRHLDPQVSEEFFAKQRRDKPMWRAFAVGEAVQP